MSENDSTEQESYFDDEEAKTLIGKHLLVGVTYLNSNDEITSYEQFHGVIVRASREDGIVVQVEELGEERNLPPDLSQLERAQPGDYRLKSSGEVVVNPDYLSTWNVYLNPAEET